MTFFPTKIFPLGILLCALVLNISCAKDSDLISDLVLNDPYADIEERSKKDVESSDEENDSSSEDNDQVEAEAQDPIQDQFDFVIDLNYPAKAFPSAQGHGADKISGGKNGKIFYVDDLGNNSNGSYDATTDTYSGSLKYALEHPEPGYVIFRVAGVARFSDLYDYLINKSNAGNKTVMGGTAPYPGVILQGHQFRVSFGHGNWIFRGLTFLGGDNLEKGMYDAFLGQDVTEVILSDNTFGWSSDESVDFDDANNIIVQRNLMIEGHPEHNTGSLFATDTHVPGTRYLTQHNNGFIHQSHRFPNVRALSTDYVDIINQCVYNLNSRIEAHKFQLNLNDVNNYYKKGPRSASSPKKKWSADDEGSPLWDIAKKPKIYSAGNILTGVTDSPSDDNAILWDQHISKHGFKSGDPLPKEFFASSMHPVGMDIKIKPAKDAFEYNIVQKNIGSRYYMNSNGERVKYIIPFIDKYFEDAINGTDYAFLNKQSLFVLPSLPSAEAPYVDNDHDGMADEWEKKHGLDLNAADHNAVKETWIIDGVKYNNHAGYTNMQMFDDYVHGGFLILKDQY